MSSVLPPEYTPGDPYIDSIRGNASLIVDEIQPAGTGLELVRRQWESASDIGDRVLAAELLVGARLGVDHPIFDVCGLGLSIELGDDFENMLRNAQTGVDRLVEE